MLVELQLRHTSDGDSIHSLYILDELIILAILQIHLVGLRHPVFL